MIERFGGDAAGMSTVHEAVFASFIKYGSCNYFLYNKYGMQEFLGKNFHIQKSLETAIKLLKNLVFY